MNRRAICYSSAVAVPLLAFSLMASPAFAQDVPTSRPKLTTEQRIAFSHRDFQKQQKHGWIGVRKGVGQRREKIREALKNNDYAAFQTLIKDAPFAAKIDQATFAKLVEAAKLRASGDPKGAKALLDAAGIKRPFAAKGRGLHKAFRGKE